VARSFLDRLSEGVVLFDGGTGTEIYARGAFLNVCYEQLNLDRPGLVEEVHRAFAQAGADVVETNTFGATRPRLEPHGLGDRVREINREAARIARRAVGTGVFVAGAMGPLGIRLEPWGPTTLEEAVELFREQAEGLVEGGVDLLVLETFADLVEIQAAIRAVRAACDLPIVAMMTVDEEGRSPEGVPAEWLARKLEETEADVVGVNCSVGPAPMLSVVETLGAVCTKPLAALPNAGLPRNVEGRLLYLASPSYMARYVRRFVAAGARVVGGCCGVTPEHVRAMREALGRPAGEEPAPRVVVSGPASPQVEPVPPPERSGLARKVAEGRFVVLVEVPPPRGWQAERVLSHLRRLDELGVDGVLVPDDPRAMVRMSPLALARLVAERAAAEGLSLEPVLQYSCRDRNLLGMQSDLLGAHALGIRNLVLVTGQVPRPGEAPWATPVFDVDAIGLVNVVHRLNHGLDVGDTPIGAPTAFFPGVQVTPAGTAESIEAEVRRFEWKVDAGAAFAVTVPVFDAASLGAFLERVAHVRIPVLAEIRPPRDLREAEFLAAEVPGVEVPAWVLERMERVNGPEEATTARLEIARRVLEEIAPLVEGIAWAGPLEGATVVLADVTGGPVPVRREFPGHPGIMGGSEGRRWET